MNQSKRICILLASLVTLIGCDVSGSSSSSFSYSSSIESLSSSSYSSSSYSSSSSERTSRPFSEESYSSYSTEQHEHSYDPDETLTLTVYSFNDFHGRINDNNQTGILSFASFLKEVNKEENTLTIDSGDTFQGSLESNYNRGEMLTEIFNCAGVDVHTLGNHDFDWGQQYLKNNIAMNYRGYSQTWLASNVYTYDSQTKTVGNEQVSSLGNEYYIETLANGLRVGVIGVIGKEQIEDILSIDVEDITFVDEISTIQKLSDELKTTHECDIVIASVHGSASSVINKGLSEISPVSMKKYCDYVVCGHSHKEENLSENEVYYTQAGSNGNAIGKAVLHIVNGEVIATSTSFIDGYLINSEYPQSKYDSDIKRIYDWYMEDVKDMGNEVLANNVSGAFYSTEILPNLVAKSVYTAAKKAYPKLQLAVVNKARASLYNTSWTYSDLYTALPFDNKIIIAEVSGYKNCKEISYSTGYYYHEGKMTLNTSETYTIAVLDFLLYHQNKNRDYNYFDFSNVTIKGTLTKDGSDYTYREITADYLRELKAKGISLKSSDFETDLTNHSVPTF